tara:strand:- start:173 stop:1084 length:912 start_codon:yes stop_codon:yes gene_type:complete
LAAIVLEIVVSSKLCDADIWYKSYLDNILYFYVSIGLTLFVVLINWMKFCLCHGYNRFDYGDNDVVSYTYNMKEKDEDMELAYTHANQNFKKQDKEINMFYKKLNKFMLNLFMVVLLFQLFYNVLHFREIVETSNGHQLTLYASTNSTFVMKDWNNFRNTTYVICNVIYILILYFSFTIYYNKKIHQQIDENNIVNASRAAYVFETFLVVIGSGLIWYGTLSPIETIPGWYIDNMDPSERNLIYIGLSFYSLVFLSHLIPNTDLLEACIRWLNQPIMDLHHTRMNDVSNKNLVGGRSNNQWKF